MEDEITGKYIFCFIVYWILSAYSLVRTANTPDGGVVTLFLMGGVIFLGSELLFFQKYFVQRSKTKTTLQRFFRVIARIYLWTVYFTGLILSIIEMKGKTIGILLVVFVFAVIAWGMWQVPEMLKKSEN